MQNIKLVIQFLAAILGLELFFAGLTFAESDKGTVKQKEDIRYRIDKSIWEELPRRVTRDFKHLYTAPKRINKKDWLKVGGTLAATGLLIAYDNELLDSMNCREEVGGLPSKAKNLGDAGYSAPALLGLYTAGCLFKSEREKETAVRGLEALTIAGLTIVGIQIVTGRERPEEGGKFKWFENGHFPSGHTAMAFALAPVFDHQYCKIETGDGNPEKFAKYLGKGIIYGLPGAVAYERLKSGSHHPSDVFASIVLTLSIGNMVNRLDDKEQKNWEISQEVGKNFAGLKFSYCW